MLPIIAERRLIMNTTSVHLRREFTGFLRPAIVYTLFMRELQRETESGQGLLFHRRRRGFEVRSICILDIIGEPFGHRRVQQHIPEFVVEQPDAEQRRRVPLY